MTKGLAKVKKKMLAKREVRAAYDALADEFSLARELIAAEQLPAFAAPRSVPVPTEGEQNPVEPQESHERGGRSNQNQGSPDQQPLR